MFLVDTIVEKIIEPIVDALLACTVRQFRYVLDCNQNIDEFAKQVENLGDAKTEVERKIEEAKNNAEVVEDKVSKWLTQVESSFPSLEEDKKRLVQAKENVQCLDVLSRYRMGREGKKKQSNVIKLTEEGKFDVVAHRPPLNATLQKIYSNKYENVPSRDLVFQQIMEALKDNKFYKIGIHGMPGVGKTRIMEEAAQKAQKEGLFEEIGKTIVSENPNLKDVQQKLAESLNLNLDKETEGARKELLHKRLNNGKKILVMVDDIWNDRIKLEDIGIPAADDHTPGCKVVLTSRIKDVCLDMGAEKDFQIEVLAEEDAWSLFQKKVGDFINNHEMGFIAKQVCGQCRGLPLAILAVGGALKHKKSKEEWQDALDQLIDSRADNIGERTAGVYSRIKLSYDYLDPSEAKSIFLLCCMFPEDADISIDELVMYAFARRLLRGIDTMGKARNRVYTLINTLKTHSLLLEGERDELVKMHDVIRDVAISIASENEEDTFLVKPSVGEWPREEEYIHRCTISLQLNKDFVFPDELKCPELHNLRLEDKDNIFDSFAPSNFFNGMHKLEVLHLSGIHISALPSSLKRLRMLCLCLYNFGSMNLAFLKELEKLEILRIVNFYQKELAPEIKFLTRLRLLNLRKCYNLKIIPSGVISSLTQLEELHIPDEFDEWEKNGNASLDELKSLRHLTTLELYVPNGNMLLPLDELQCKHLIRFKIAIGSRLNWRDLSSATKVLKLVGIPLRTEIIILMEKAEVLFLEKLKGLKDVFHNKEFLDLKLLKVDDCDGVEHLFGNPKSISQIKGLCELKVYNCQIRSLFSKAVAGSLPQLQELDIQFCEKLEEIISSDDQEVVHISFHRLKKLSLEYLPNLRGFFGCNTTTSLTQAALFSNTVKFPALEELQIIKLGSLTTIWDNQSFLGLEAHDSFLQVKKFFIQGCDKIVNVIPPNVVPWFQNLDKLTVRLCDSVVSIVKVASFEQVTDEIHMFPQLNSLELRKLQKLKTFCYISSGGSIEEEEGRGKILVFPQLNNLKLEELPRLGSFCCSRRGGEEIVEVEEEEGNIPQPQQLFNHKVDFPVLTGLRCDGSIVEGIGLDHLVAGSSGKIRIVEVNNYNNLVNASSLVQQFEVVEQIKLRACSSVEVIFSLDDGLDKERQSTVFSQLKELRLLDLPKLEHIWITEPPKGLQVFHNLTSLQVFRCNKLRYVFSLSIARCLTQLRELRIRSCSEMEEIVRSEGQGEEDDLDQIVFPQLHALWFKDLQNLTCFSRRTNAFNFRSLKTVDLWKCPKLETFTFRRISPLGINGVWRKYDKLEEDVTHNLNREVHERVKEIEDKREGERGGPSHNDVVQKEDIDDK